MIVDGAVYRGGERVDSGCAKDDFTGLRAAARTPGDFVWIGISDPDDAELAAAAEAFGLHRLAVEDALKAHQRPKLDRYRDHLHLVLKTLWYVDADDAVETGEISLLLGPDFVLTVRHGEGLRLGEARHRLEESAEVLAHGPSAVLYAVMDIVVDTYRDVVMELDTDVDEVEASVFSPERTRDSERIYTLKREIAEVRRAVLPLREPTRRLSLGEVAGVTTAAAPFFRDVLDHLTQASESVDALDQLLSTAFDAHLADISVQQNDDMRKISAGAALVVVPTLIAGIYGMNFPLAPPGDSQFGFWFAIVLMVASVAVLFWFFKRSTWL